MVQLYDLGPAVFAVTIVLMVLCAILTLTRLWVRFHWKGLGYDDYTCIVGLIFWLVANAFALLAVMSGLGARSEHITASQEVAARKWVTLYQMFYVISNTIIKISICLSILRVFDKNWYRWVVWTIYLAIILSAGSSLSMVFWFLSFCKPVSAIWDRTAPGAHCGSEDEIGTAGKAYSVVNLAVDWFVALLPVVFLWKVQLPWKLKLTAMSILSLGLIFLWTTVELGLALSAVSLMAMGPLWRRVFPGKTVGREQPELAAQQQQQHPPGGGDTSSYIPPVVSGVNNFFRVYGVWSPSIFSDSTSARNIGTLVPSSHSKSNETTGQ
ncbi:hypothetical protein BX600DRAFT_435338 [Xylariales sp. PMI_506]|nr:hypothetical protein BX600DRAFT_435338 [Xylariales sp. PMI_506]